MVHGFRNLIRRPFRRVLPEMNAERLPDHVAVIMDGNGRWAKQRGLPRSLGHKAGVDRLEEIVEAAADLGLKYLTLYAFSTENWRRDPEEVQYLMHLFVSTLAGRTQKLHKDHIRLRFIGRRDRLAPELVAKMEESERLTADNQRLTLVLAIDYGSRDEMLNAVNTLARQAVIAGIERPDFTEEDLAATLFTAEIPDPDLIIRPSGEYRLSNFLLWQGAYAELWFTPVLWPDFSRRHLVEALQAYAGRARRFGKA